MTHLRGLDIRLEYHDLARTLTHRLAPAVAARGARGLVIGVAGESGSGKSITATCLARELAAAGLVVSTIHQDDYFIRPPRTNHEHRLLDLAHVGPHEVNLALVAEHIAAFRTRHGHVVGPVVDYPGNRFLTQVFDFSVRDVLIVEGTYVLLLDDLDVRIFLEASHEDTRERRRLRNRDIDAPVIHDILAIEHRLIAPQAQRADIVIDRHFAIRHPA